MSDKEADGRETTLTEDIFSLLDKVGKVSDGAGESLYEMGEAKADGEGVLGRTILNTEYVGRAVGLKEGLVNKAKAGHPPGTIETALDIWDFLAGKG